MHTSFTCSVVSVYKKTLRETELDNHFSTTSRFRIGFWPVSTLKVWKLLCH